MAHPSAWQQGTQSLISSTRVRKLKSRKKQLRRRRRRQIHCLCRFCCLPACRCVWACRNVVSLTEVSSSTSCLSDVWLAVPPPLLPPHPLSYFLHLKIWFPLTKCFSAQPSAVLYPFTTFLNNVLVLLVLLLQLLSLRPHFYVCLSDCTLNAAADLDKK